MTESELISLIDTLRAFPTEQEWFEFKENRYTPEELGEYISALANAACLNDKPHGYLIFGIHDKKHDIVGTSFDPYSEKGKGDQPLQLWLTLRLQPNLGFTIYPVNYSGKHIIVFEINAAIDRPVSFHEKEWIRIGECKTELRNHPEKVREIWNRKYRLEDWSAQICEKATIDDLDPVAIQNARENFKSKFIDRAHEIDKWDDVTFLNKAKITKNSKITNTALLLLGKNESEHFLSPAVGKISWILKDENNNERDYQHYSLPFLLTLESVYAKIRNLTYRYLLDNTLFPTEVTKYEPYIIRESLNNCVAHQDYLLGGRITLVEFPDELIFSNLGSFIPGTVEKVIRQDAPQEYYRNAFLANAMVNLKLIDTQGGGIKKMFSMQIARHFPLPSYVLSDPGRVQVKIAGKVIDENYTRLLIQKTNLDVSTIILLDKIQKHESVSKEEATFLRQEGLVEGRYPSIHISLPIAKVTDKKAEYIRHRKFDDSYYEKLIFDFIKEYGSASRQDINRLLTGKLPEQLAEAQKLNKISNILARMSRQEHRIKNTGSAKKPKWSIPEEIV